MSSETATAIRSQDKPSDFDLNHCYKCGEEIDQGGFGVVYEGTRVIDGVPVAIKSIPRTRITNWKQMDGHGPNIPLEIAVLKKLALVPGVIKLLDYFDKPEKFLIVMERPALSKDLFNYLRSARVLSEDEARRFFCQLVKIIVQCHKAGVVHRDIKLENILIDLSLMEIKLIDFGAAAEFPAGEKDFDFYDSYDGTSIYTPPEWIQEKVFHGMAATVWSLGLVLFAMVCGDIPFNETTSILYADPEFRLEVSRECQDLVELCLMKNPVERISYEGILVHPWMQAGIMTTIFSGENNGSSDMDSTVNLNMTTNQRNPTHSILKSKKKLQKISINPNFTVAYNTRSRKGLNANAEKLETASPSSAKPRGRKLNPKERKSIKNGFDNMGEAEAKTSFKIKSPPCKKMRIMNGGNKNGKSRKA